MKLFKECITFCGNEVKQPKNIFCDECFIKKCIYEKKKLIRTTSGNTKERT